MTDQEDRGLPLSILIGLAVEIALIVLVVGACSALSILPRTDIPILR